MKLQELEARIECMNQISSSPKGYYHLSRAYGGYAVCRTCDGTGVTDVFGYHMPKKLLLVCINSWLQGYGEATEDHITKNL